MNNIFWTAYSKQDKTNGMLEVQEIVNNYGFIIDFKQFSDISMVIHVEIEEFKICKLFAALSKCVTVDNFQNTDSDSQRERNLFIHINFVKGTGDLRVEIPAISE
jgi:hypothetical protein